MKYPITFNALVLESIRKLSLKKVQFCGPLKKRQVLVKVFYSGICGKQVEEFTGKMGKDKFLPHLLGHEASGEVLDVGSSVKNVKIKDKVVLHWVKNKKISDSEAPTYNYLKNKKKINSGRISTFSEISIVSNNRVTKINPKTNMKLAALMGCCVTTGVGTVFNQSKVSLRDKILVVGVGGVGLSIIIGLKLKKIKNICALDHKLKNLRQAKILGAEKTINAKKNFPKKLGKFTKIFISTGALPAIKNAIELSNKESDIYFVGNPSPKSKITIRPNDIQKGKNLHSSSGGSIIPQKHIPEYINLANKNKKLFKKLIIDEIELSKAINIIKKMNLGKNNHGRNLIRLKN